MRNFTDHTEAVEALNAGKLKDGDWFTVGGERATTDGTWIEYPAYADADEMQTEDAQAASQITKGETMDKTFTAVLLSATRRGHSRNGNPTWNLHTSEGDYRTKTDAQIGYMVSNFTSSRYEGVELRFTVNGRGHVVDIEEVD